MIKEKTYTRGSLALNYAEGPPSGPPILFLHGLTDRWQFFQPVFPFLSQRWHVYALDFRGHGASGHEPPYRYLDHINDVVGFIEDVVGEKVVLYAASLDRLVQSVSDMPISIPWRKPGKYGDGLDYISVLNKALYLRSLDPAVLEPGGA